MTDLRFDREAWTRVLFETRESRWAYEDQRGEDLESWQAGFREALADTLGLPAIERGGVPDLDPDRRGTERVDGHEREAWTLRSERTVDLPFYVLLPEGGEPPYPVVVALHGHTPAGKDLVVGNVTGEDGERGVEDEARDFARQAVERGYAVVAPDVRGFGGLAADGEWRGSTWTCGRLQMHGQLFGRSLVGDRVWDLERLVDFVETNSRFDDDRIAVVGHSGGGTVALFGAALDPRLSPVVVSSYFCTFEDSIAAGDHCECNYVPGVLELGEMYDVAGLIAPRPFRALAGREDGIFPIEGAREAHARLEAVYEAADAADRCDLYAGDGGHRFYPEGAWPFVERHL